MALHCLSWRPIPVGDSIQAEIVECSFGVRPFALTQVLLSTSRMAPGGRSVALQHHKQRHQSLTERRQKRKERQCLLERTVARSRHRLLPSPPPAPPLNANQRQFTATPGWGSPHERTKSTPASRFQPPTAGASLLCVRVLPLTRDDAAAGRTQPVVWLNTPPD